MFKIYNIKDKREYIEEFAILCKKEWGKTITNPIEFKTYIQNKIAYINSQLDEPFYCTLILLDNDVLVGFISIYPHDCDEREYLGPWYATMYVKEEYRGHHYSKILNDAILEEARKRNIKRLYLKTTLLNYYEKFGAIFLETLSNNERIYYFDI